MYHKVASYSSRSYGISTEKMEKMEKDGENRVQNNKRESKVKKSSAKSACNSTRLLHKYEQERPQGFILRVDCETLTSMNDDSTSVHRKSYRKSR